MGSKTCSQNIYILTNLYLHIWFITKTWLNFLVHDFKKDYNFFLIFKNPLMSLVL